MQEKDHPQTPRNSTAKLDFTQFSLMRRTGEGLGEIENEAFDLNLENSVNILFVLLSEVFLNNRYYRFRGGGNRTRDDQLEGYVHLQPIEQKAKCIENAVWEYCFRSFSCF